MAKWRNKWYDQYAYDKYTRAQFNQLSKYDRISFTERIREWLFRKLGKTCNICQVSNDSIYPAYYYEIDHIKPIQFGGSNELGFC